METKFDSRGPIQHRALRPVVSREGVETKTVPMLLPEKKTSFQARWIGMPQNPRIFLVRREVSLAHVPKQVPTYLSADCAYRLWINGVLVSRGPADIGMDYHRVPTGKWFYDTIDTAPYLTKGKNAIVAEVFAEPVIGWEGTRGVGGFFAELEGIAATDSSWKTTECHHWTRLSGELQYVSAKEPSAWRLPGFDDSAWLPATVLRDLWQPLVASEIPARMEVVYPIQSIVRSTVPLTHLPATLTRNGSFAVRYDRVLPGYLSFVVRGGAGATLRIEPNEPNAPGHHRQATALLGGEGLQVFELPFMDSFSVVNLSVSNLTEPLEILDVRATYVSQPLTYKGQFSCSDPNLTRLWSICRWATQICLQTHHLDSPHHQEPISDPGDYLIASLINYCAFHQPALTRQDTRKYAWILTQCKNQNFHTSYALLWLQMLLDYYDYTGDAALVRELAPVVHSLLDTFTGYRGKNGLISEAPNYMFLDWVDIAGFPGHHPPAVIGQGYLTAFYYRALFDAQRVAELLGDRARSESYIRLRAETAAAFERELWVEEKGLYRDGKPFQTSVKPGQWLPADKEIETFTAHVNILAALYDLAPADRRVAVVERAITGPNFSCQPYFMHFVFAALAHTGLFDRHAPDQLKRWKVVEETQSLREMWTTGDLSHSWGATPLYQLSAHVLGVRPAAPGFSTIAIAPKLCGLTWAKGSVPTPHGSVDVSWKRSRTALSLMVGVPSGCSAEVTVPGESEVRRVGPGKHTWTVLHGA